MKKIAFAACVIMALSLGITVYALTNGAQTQPEPFVTFTASEASDTLADNQNFELAEVEPIEATPAGAIPLTVFVYDNCGGCGVGLQGCGACDVQDALHILMLRIFGQRLHGEEMTYRLLNTRHDAHNYAWQEKLQVFAVPDEHGAALPMAFIGTEQRGVFVPSELIAVVDEFFDRFASGEDVAGLQAEILRQAENPWQHLPNEQVTVIDLQE